VHSVRKLTEQPDAPGATYLAYTPNGKKLVTAGVDNYCRVFSTGSDDEPVTVDNCQEDNTTVVAGVGTWILEKREDTNRTRRTASSSQDQRMAQ
jgi:chromosome transmission fidelity protein 4